MKVNKRVDVTNKINKNKKNPIILIYIWKISLINYLIPTKLGNNLYKYKPKYLIILHTFKPIESTNMATILSTQRFRRGDLVEVASKQEGFVGSYYEATVVADLGGSGGYLVQYRTLLEDDMSSPLREVAADGEVRPRPPPDEAEEYRLYEVVDVFDNDGWWWGWIAGRSGDGYTVVFETTRDEIFYHRNLLRTHREWIDGRWMESTLVRVD